MPGEGKGTSFSTGITIVANIVGAGLLSLPYTVASAGLVSGVLALLLTGALNCLSALLLARSCEMSGAGSYMELVGSVLGGAAKSRVAVLLAVYTLGSCASYVVVLGDQLPSLLALVGVPQGPLTSQGLVLPLVGIFVLYPLSLLRDLSSLRLTSSGSFACIVFVSLLVVGKALRGPLADPRYLVVAKASPGVFVGLPIALVSFTMHYNLPRFWGEFSAAPERKMAAFSAIVVMCFLFVAATYEVVAVSGYLLFGSAVNGNPAPVSAKGDILVDFGSGDAAVVVARFALVITQILNFPIVFNSHRAACISLLPLAWQQRFLGDAGPAAAGSGSGGGSSGGSGSSSGGGSSEAEGASAPLLEGSSSSGKSSAASWLHREGPHGLLTAALIAASVTFAVAVPNLSMILGIKGALGATLIVYALPAAIYFVLCWRLAGGSGGGGGGALELGTPLSEGISGQGDRGAASFSLEAAAAPSPLRWGTDSGAATPATAASGSRGSRASAAAGAGEGAGGARDLARELCCTRHGALCVFFCIWAAVVMVLGMVKTLAPSALM